MGGGASVPAQKDDDYGQSVQDDDDASRHAKSIADDYSGRSTGSRSVRALALHNHERQKNGYISAIEFNQHIRSSRQYVPADLAFLDDVSYRSARSIGRRSIIQPISETEVMESTFDPPEFDKPESTFDPPGLNPAKSLTEFRNTLSIGALSLNLKVDTSGMDDSDWNHVSSHSLSFLLNFIMIYCYYC